ncbi:MAG: hypothetical protein ABIT64_06015 [Lysobacteraceae bacterium]
MNDVRQVNDLRHLLLDCRSALRRSNLRSQDDLRDRLEATLITLNKPAESKTKGNDDFAEPETRSAQQVAYAWQIAARSLRMTHPDLHNNMVERVHAMLNVNMVHDPGTELLVLQTKAESATAELDALRDALGEAVPLVGRDAIGTEAECAQRRLQLLIKAASEGGGLPAQVSDNPIDMAHSREELKAVAMGKRELSRWERAWCVAEALVMTGKSPDQLQKLADAALVKLVLAGSTATPE